MIEQTRRYFCTLSACGHLARVASPCALALALAVVWCCAGVVMAQTNFPAPNEWDQRAAQASAPQVPLAEALRRRGDLTLRDSSLNAALVTISQLWGINVVAGEVPGSVNGVFKDAPLQEILDSILISNGYGYRAVGESLVVGRQEDLGQVNPFFESATILVGAADVNDVVAGAELLKTPRGQIKAIPSASSIFVLDFPDRVKMIRDFAASVDAAARRAAGGAPVGMGPQELQVAYLKTHFVDAKHAETLLKTVLSPSGRIAVMEEEDRLLVVDFAANLQMAANVLQRIDRPRPQVSIRALIYDISLQDKEELGLNWQSLSGGSLDTSISGGGGITSDGTLTSGTGTLFNSVTKAPFTEGSAGSAFTFYTLNSNLNLAAVAMALQEASDSRLLASPNVTVVDNQEATIESVQEIPFQQLTQTAAGGNIGTTAFRDAGVTLRVTPKIALDGTIEMVVRPEFSRLTGFTPGDNQPIIDRRTTETRVRIANGQTYVVAGLRQRADIGDFKGVPFFKDVRFLGHLFRARETDVTESELVVFLNPTIIGYDEPMARRDQQTADTVHCRLAQIPVAEGCPPGCTGCGPTGYCGAATYGPHNSVDSVPQVAPTIGDSPRPAAPLDPHNVLPEPPAEPLPADAELTYPELSRNPPRRLPPVDDQPATMVATEPSNYPSRASTPETTRLRPDYDSRYRAAGGVYPSQQRQAPASNEEPGEKKAPFWKRWTR